MKRVHLLALCAALCSIAYTGCKKDKKDNLNTGDDNVKVSKLVPTAITPTVENGMLAFTDETQFKNYLIYLDTIIRPDTTNPFDTLTGDDKLDGIESQFAYNSLRKKVNQDFAQTDAAGFTSLENHPVPEWFIDRVGMSVYNTDRCVKVGGKINFWYSKNIGVFIEDGSVATMTLAKNLPAGLTQTQVASRLAYRNSKVYDLGSLPAQYTLSNAFKTTADTPWKTNFHILPRVDCSNNSRTFTLDAISLQAQGVDPFNLIGGIRNKLDIQVNWGDGNTDVYYNQVANNSGGVIEWPMLYQAHTYATSGTYNLTIKVKMSYHSTWVAEATSTLVIDPYMCGAWGAKRSGQYAGYYSDVACEGEIETYQNWYNSITFCATTRGYKFENSKYRHKKQDRLCVQLYVNTFYNCGGSPTYNSGAEWPYSEKTICTSIRLGRMLSNASYQVAVGNHRTYKGTQNFANLDMNLQRCN